MVAFSASRLVWSAISLIRLTTSPIFCAAAARLSTLAFAPSASRTAVLAISEEWVTRRAISCTDAVISSVAEATVCTFTEASSDAPATAVVRWLDSSADELMALADDLSCSAAAVTPDSICLAALSKSSIILLTLAARSASARNRASSASRALVCSPSIRSRSIAFCLNTSTACAIEPSSSPRSRRGTSANKSPSAKRFIAFVMATIGEDALVPTNKPMAMIAKIPAMSAISSTSIKFFQSAKASSVGIRANADHPSPG